MATANVCTRPISSDAKNAPASDPMPPTTTTTKMMDPTEAAMAGSVGSIIFVVVVVGGMGSLAGAFLASLLIGLVQTFAVAIDYSVASALQSMGVAVSETTFGWPLLKLTVSQVAPILPYLFLVLILIFRPKGLLGTRED